MDRTAVISDIHANMAALEAVLEDIEGLGVRRIVCLGDVIGYGPEPREVLAAVAERCEWMLLGNHEEGLVENKAQDFNDRARSALEWTGDRLNDASCPEEENYALWDHIDEMERARVEGELLFVHASPRDPVREYVLPQDALDRQKMQELYTAFEQKIAFGGHTHVPGVFEDGKFFRHQSMLDEVYRPDGKALVNVGSVGQPRDGDPRSCYLVIEEDGGLRFRRVRYDVERTVRKIREVPQLHDFLAARLVHGR